MNEDQQRLLEDLIKQDWECRRKLIALNSQVMAAADNFSKAAQRLERVLGPRGEAKITEAIQAVEGLGSLDLVLCMLKDLFSERERAKSIADQLKAFYL